MADFGLRYTSVGTDGGERTSSAKIGVASTGAADNDAFTVTENDLNSINLLSNDNTLDYTVTAVDDASGSFTATVDGFERLVVIDGMELGTLTVAADGTATFVADGADVDRLALNENKIYSFVYTSGDGAGSTALATGQVTINGANDAPQIVAGGDLTGTVDEDGEDAPLVAVGQLSATDIDDGAILSWSVAGGGDGFFGTLSVDETGHWSYTLNNDDPNVQNPYRATASTRASWLSLPTNTAQPIPRSWPGLFNALD